MRATLLLCDYVVVADGKLFISGAGWSIAAPGPVTCGIALLLSVPWEKTNTQLALLLELLHEDGEPVTVPTPVGEVPVQIGANIEVGRPAGLKHGSPVDLPLAIDVPPLELQFGGRCYWQLSINGDHGDDWQLAFSVQQPG